MAPEVSIWLASSQGLSVSFLALTWLRKTVRRCASGGLTLYMDKGDLIYEYNMMIIERYTVRRKIRFRSRDARGTGVPGSA